MARMDRHEVSWLGIIPEGIFKKSLRRIYRTINSIPFKEWKEENIWNYKFKNGVHIKFYDKESSDLLNPLRGYLRYYTPKKSDVIIDGGAYHGIFSIYCSKLIGNKGKIYAFEPHPKLLKTLMKNIKLNKCRNIQIIKSALWDKKGKLRITDRDSLSMVDNLGKFEIQCIDLDSLNLERINFIKLDIEGAELKAIDGMKQTLLRLKPKLAIASYHIVDGYRTYKKVEEKLRELNYKTWTTSKYHLTTYGEKED